MNETEITDEELDMSLMMLVVVAIAKGVYTAVTEDSELPDLEEVNDCISDSMIRYSRYLTPKGQDLLIEAMKQVQAVNEPLATGQIH